MSTNVEESGNKENSSELVKVEQHESGLCIVTFNNNDNESCICLGQKRLTEFMSKEECIVLLDQRDWKVLMGYVCAVCETILDNNKNN